MGGKQKIVMSAHAKLVAELEIKKRLEALQAKFFSLATIFALRLVVEEQTKNGGPNAASTLTRNELLQKATYDALCDLWSDTLLLLHFNNSEALLSAFSTTNVFDNNAIKGKMAQCNSDLIKPLITNLIMWLPIFSTNIWAQAIKTDQVRECQHGTLKDPHPKNSSPSQCRRRDGTRPSQRREQ